MPETGSSTSSFLTQKVGGMPLWTIAAGGGVAVGGLMWWRKRNAAAQAAASNTASSGSLPPTAATSEELAAAGLYQPPNITYNIQPGPQTPTTQRPPVERPPVVTPPTGIGTPPPVTRPVIPWWTPRHPLPAQPVSTTAPPVTAQAGGKGLLPKWIPPVGSSPNDSGKPISAAMSNAYPNPFQPSYVTVSPLAGAKAVDWQTLAQMTGIDVPTLTSLNPQLAGRSLIYSGESVRYA